MDIDEKLGIDWAKLAKYTTILAENASPTFEGAGSLVPGITQTLNADGTVLEVFSPVSSNQTPPAMYFERIGATDGGPRFSRQMTAFDITLDFLLKENKADILADSN